MPILDVYTGNAPPLAAGGTCYLCNTAPKGLWLRTTRDIEYEGELDICGACALELGHAAGLVAADKADRLEDRVKEAQDELDRLRPNANAYLGLIEAAREQAVDSQPSAPKPRSKATGSKKPTKVPAEAKG